MASTIKVDNIQNQPGNNLINRCSATTTIGSGAGNTINVDGAAITLGRCGGTVSIASGATTSGMGRTGTVDWVTTPKTATFTAVSGEGYFANTTAGVFNMNLPAGSAGAIVSVADYAATFQNNNLTVVPNGSDKIGGTNANTSLSTEGQSVTFVYVDSTQGWINTMDSTSNQRGISYITACGGNATVTCGNYKTHIFTGPGTFTVSALGARQPESDNVEYLVVAAGGGGGSGPNSDAGGGGGAGGFRMRSTSPGSNSPLNAPANLTITATGYPIAVGSGGAGGPCGNPGTAGGVSTFHSITSAGGGKGNYGAGGGGPTGTSNGGSGGGVHQEAVALGNQPPVSPPQGSNGGTSGPSCTCSRNGGGGGGASAVGGNASPGIGGTGGAGSYISTPFVGPTAPSYGTPGPVGSTRYFAGGGAGGSSPGRGGQSAASGGAGGGGGLGCIGTANTGGGAGGGNGAGNNGGTGGSGIVMIRYRYQ